jgi:hypothetical protein
MCDGDPWAPLSPLWLMVCSCYVGIYDRWNLSMVDLCVTSSSIMGGCTIMVDAWEDFNLMFNGCIYGGEFHLLQNNVGWHANVYIPIINFIHSQMIASNNNIENISFFYGSSSGNLQHSCWFCPHMTLKGPFLMCWFHLNFCQHKT